MTQAVTAAPTQVVLFSGQLEPDSRMEEDDVSMEGDDCDGGNGNHRDQNDANSEDSEDSEGTESDEGAPTAARCVMFESHSPHFNHFKHCVNALLMCTHNLPTYQSNQTRHGHSRNVFLPYLGNHISVRRDQFSKILHTYKNIDVVNGHGVARSIVTYCSAVFSTVFSYVVNTPTVDRSHYINLVRVQGVQVDHLEKQCAGAAKSIKNHINRLRRSPTNSTADSVFYDRYESIRDALSTIILQTSVLTAFAARSYRYQRWTVPSSWEAYEHFLANFSPLTTEPPPSISVLSAILPEQPARAAPTAAQAAVPTAVPTSVAASAHEASGVVGAVTAAAATAAATAAPAGGAPRRRK